MRRCLKRPRFATLQVDLSLGIALQPLIACCRMLLNLVQEVCCPCRMEPGHREEYVAYLRSKEQWGQAAQQLADLVNDDTFRSIECKSKHHLWLELCDLITKHPDDVRSMNIDAIIRAGIRKFPTEVGRLWRAPGHTFCIALETQSIACSPVPRPVFVSYTHLDVTHMAF